MKRKDQTCLSFSSKDASKQKTTPREFDDLSVSLCLFCFGKKCRFENYQFTKGQIAIQGLNSNWVTDNIVAMQRPSERLIKEFDIVKQFQENNIKTIFNLQEPGEHGLCGDGLLDKTGFSYDYQTFEQNGVYFYNYSWTDMGIPTFQLMIKLINLYDFAKKIGKVAVHCHAGRGRTGIVICGVFLKIKSFQFHKVCQLKMLQYYLENKDILKHLNHSNMNL